DTVPGTFTEEVVTQIEKADKNRKPGSSSLRELLYMGHGMKPGTKWPQHGKRRPVFKASLTDAYGLAGARLAHVVVELNSKREWQVNWSLSSIFKLLPEDDGQEKTEVEHRPSGTKATIDNAIPVGTEWRIEEPWSELSAVLKYSRTTVPLAELFEEAAVQGWLSHTATERFAASVARANIQFLPPPAAADAAPAAAAAPAGAAAGSGDAPPPPPGRPARE
ncbi:unnamed protein product, partial [Prorocentrum cordatum]